MIYEVTLVSYHTINSIKKYKYGITCQVEYCMENGDRLNRLICIIGTAI